MQEKYSKQILLFIILKIKIKKPLFKDYNLNIKSYFKVFNFFVNQSRIFQIALMLKVDSEKRMYIKRILFISRLGLLM